MRPALGTVAVLAFSASIYAQAQLAQESGKTPAGLVFAVDRIDHGDLTLDFVVTDASGAVITDAGLSVTQEETGATFSGRTSSTGAYRMPDLAPGTYAVEVKRPGFRVQDTRIRLRDDLVDRVTIMLDVDPTGGGYSGPSPTEMSLIPTTTSSLDRELLPEPTTVDKPQPPSPSSKPNPIRRFFSAVGHKLGF